MSQAECEVLIAVPHSGLAVNLEWAVNFASVWKHAPPKTKLMLMPEPQIDVARNKAVAAALQIGASHVFFLDSDVHPPNDVIQRLLNHGMPIASGLYARRQNPPRNQMLHRKGDEYEPIEEGMFEPGTLVECDAVGLGCVLIKTQVFRAIGAPWFRWTEGYVLGGVSEDYDFCAKIREGGFKIIVDTSIVCRHSGLIKWLPPSRGGNVFEYSTTTGLFSD